MATPTSFLWRLHGGWRWRRQALTHQLEEQQEHQQATVECSWSGGSSFVPPHRWTTGDSTGSLTLVFVSVLVSVLIPHFAGAFALVHFGLCTSLSQLPFIYFSAPIYFIRSLHILLKNNLNSKKKQLLWNIRQIFAMLFYLIIANAFSFIPLIFIRI